MRLIIVFLSIFFFPVASSAWSGKVTGVLDGDTLKVARGGDHVTVRLYGIDTPEKKQAYGNRAKKLTNKIVRGKNVVIKEMDTDRYGRTVALVYLNGQSLNQYLVQEGYAWVYTKYCRESFCSTWKGIETFARLQERGMWADPDIIPPWIWRKMQRKGSAQQAGITAKQMPAPEERLVGSNEADAGLLPYHGNVRSRKYHRSSCKNYSCKNCTAIFYKREDAIMAGYEPCGQCQP